eukprot:TRINITY_DN57328_c0_g1_i1.p1 TRINITY_DN57328_c0_g1~~TRINITY_DN57328_c0_g1_i1.p1  ORF type:complete len:413 (+),score=110.56 TRINITY_DN57328_c0_g1_i1:201-1439(+)
MSKRIAIVSACRTPIGTFGGSLKSVPAYDLGATVMKEAIKRANIDASLIDDVRFGCCMEPVEALNTARIAALQAKIPSTVPAVSINRVCTSAMEAITSGANAILAGQSKIILAGGMESMSNAPYVLPEARWGARMMDKPMVDAMMWGLHAGSHVIKYPKDGPVTWARGKPYIMGLTAEFLAQKYGITRAEMDEVALRSHNNTERAVKEGKFKDEIVGVKVAGKKPKDPPTLFENDEHFRPGLTLDAVKKLDPVFIPKVGTVTAANSSGINDGASAMLIMAEDTAKEMGLEPLALLSGWAMGGCEPEVMGESPVPACNNLFRKMDRKVSDYGLVELNEAFAAQYIACEKQIGWKREVANVNGGGIGLGHPVGSSGCRIMVSLLYEMRRTNTKRGLATICGGGGVGFATELVLP